MAHSKLERLQFTAFWCTAVSDLGLESQNSKDGKINEKCEAPKLVGYLAKFMTRHII